MSKYIILAILLIICSCGLEPVFKQIAPNLYVSSNSPENLDNLIINTVNMHEINYGVCPHKTHVTLRSLPFTCGGYLAGGCSYRNSEYIQIGVDHYSECSTSYEILHELMHSCQNLPDCYNWNTDGSLTIPADCWINDLNKIVNKMYINKQCNDSKEDLYPNYIWE